jgi:hypothetical protein
MNECKTRPLPNNRQSLVACVAVFVSSFVLLFAVSKARVNQYDEGLILTGAMRVLNGELPSRDFYANYGPAQFVILAGCFSWLGADLLVARTYDNVLAATIITLVWLSIRGVRRKFLAWSCVATVLGLVIFDRIHLYPVTPAIVLVLFGCDVGARGVGCSWTLSRYGGVAMCIAGLMLFRYDLAVLAAIGLGLPLLLMTCSQVREGIITQGRAITIATHASATVLVAIALVCGMLWATGILGPALSDLLTYTLPTYRATRSLPFPGIEVALRDLPQFFSVYFAIAALAVAFVALALVCRRTAGRCLVSDMRLVKITIFSSAAALMYIKGLVRVSPQHMLLANVPAAVALYLATDVLDEMLAARSWAVASFVSGSVATVFAGYFCLALKSNSWGHPIYLDYASIRNPPALVALRGFGATDDEVWAASYIIANTKPTDRILSATGRHDKVLLNNCAIYFVAGRLPGTRWHQYDPGVQTTQAVQEAIIRDISAQRVGLVVRDRSWDEIVEPNDSRFSSGITLLDEYIASQFNKDAEHGRIEIWRPRATGR